MKEAVQELLVRVQQGVQLMREGKNDMEVRGVNDFLPAFIHPDLLLESLAGGTGAVPAGAVMDLDMPAAGAAADAVPEVSGLAV